MRLRTRHLACLLLLLSSLSAAEGSTTRSADLSAGGRYISMLLSQRAAAATVQAQPIVADTASYKIEAFALTPASRSQQTAAWTMRPPAEHTTALQATTSTLS
jgi:hypothetical protein